MNLLLAVVCYALQAYFIILFLRFILSWVTMFWSPPPALSPALRVVYELTEPVMAFFRRFIPPIGGLDLSLLVVFVILQVAMASIGC
ncbi:MAG: YggT family protein [Actinomycetota bacterium]